MIETVKMSSKGQIVIPKDIREDIQASEGTIFAIIQREDSVILKKVITPSKQELIRDLEKIAIGGRKRAEKIGIKESDVPEMIHKLRKLRIAK